MKCRDKRIGRLKAVFAGPTWNFSNFIDSFTRLWCSNYLLPCVWSNQFGALMDGYWFTCIPMYWKYFQFYPIRFVANNKGNCGWILLPFYLLSAGQKIANSLVYHRNEYSCEIVECKICKMELVKCAYKSEKVLNYKMFDSFKYFSFH